MQDLEDLKQNLDEEDKKKIGKMQDDLVKVVEKYGVTEDEIRHKELIRKRTREQFKKKNKP